MALSEQVRKVPWRAPLGWLPRLVARVPARIHLKLFVAFLAIALLLVTLGLVGIQALGAANDRSEELGDRKSVV